MSTYLINHLRIPGGVPDEDGLAYLEQVDDTLRAHGGRVLARGAVDVLEGAWPGSAVLIEFPSRADAENWYGSPEYERIHPLRTNSSVSDVILIDSVPADFTSAGLAGEIRAMTGGSGATG